MKIKPGIIFSFFYLFILYPASGQTTAKEFAVMWADSVFNQMTLEEKIGQLFIIRAHSDKNKSYHDHVGRTIENYHVGGVCFFQGGPWRQAKLTNRYQNIADVPLFVAQDAEWGLGMRLDSTISFPRQMTLGAISENGLIYDMGREVANHCKRIGVNMNFAPVVDVNSNPNNPVINSRSFGESPEDVAAKASMYIYGMQDNGVIATAKHFPGHGDTDTDSHKTLPVIHHDRKHMDSVDLVPFKRAIKDGVTGIMPAHLHIPAYDSTAETASSLSRPVITGLLKEKLQYNGLIITDALEMSGVTQNNSPGDLEVKALLAGNDILLLPVDIKKAVSKIKAALREGVLSQEEVDRKVKKILMYKQFYNIHRTRPVEVAGIQKHLHNPGSEKVIRQIAAEAVTVINNKNNLLPLRRPDTMRIAALATGVGEKQVFQDYLDFYGPVTHFFTGKNISDDERDDLLEKLKDYDLILLSVHNTSSFPFRDFGISESERSLADSLAARQRVVLTIFGIPYALSQFIHPAKYDGLIVAYEDRPEMQQVSAQIIYGGMRAKGRMPVSVGAYSTHHGITTPKIRLSLHNHLDLGIKEKYIRKIDSIASDGIKKKAYPGCQILMARDGQIFYDKRFGHHTYSKKIPVKYNDLYDLASLTKIAATTLSIMELTEDSLINIDRRLSYYLPFLRHTNKSEMIIRDVMAHQAGLQAWIPYYVNTLLDDAPDSMVYRNHLTEKYNIRVAEDLFIHGDYRYKIFDTIAKSPLREPVDYKYSDLGFYLLYRIVEEIVNRPFEDYVEDVFYQPLGLKTMRFHPKSSIDEERLIPTEKDDVFRDQLLKGDVHDPGAAMLGGVSGHAGLFSNAYDMAVLMQMLLDGGTYGGQRFFRSETVQQFTRTQFPLDENRRGIGFDKPVINGEDDGPTCESASENSFGHSGFTGTYAWADPDNGTVYVFLSNRIHPDGSNRKLIEMDIRTKIQQVMYNALEDMGL